MCYGNYLEGNLNYVVYGDLAVSISQEKQNNFRATLRLILQFMLSNKNVGEKAVKHWEGNNAVTNSCKINLTQKSCRKQFAKKSIIRWHTC